MVKWYCDCLNRLFLPDLMMHYMYIRVSVLFYFGFQETAKEIGFSRNDKRDRAVRQKDEQEMSTKWVS